MKIGIESNLLRSLFQNVYFINGTAYAGKSTAVKLLAERFDGVCCGENFHDALTDAIDPAHQPNLSYFQTMSGWQEFLNRPPKAYAAWIDGSSREAAEMEILLLIRLSQSGRPVFVDTNIPPDMLREISDFQHVAILLSPQSTSVDRFFDRPDPDKQFLLDQIHSAEDPEATLSNFLACIAEINSPERYRAFEESGFFVHVRDDRMTPEETMLLLARHFGLPDQTSQISDESSGGNLCQRPCNR